ncbi:MAG TPA: DUF5131 family protein [Desulfobacterales bacterium]|nr:DUF5131 family protein [Desulfobacterales bacterium]
MTKIEWCDETINPIVGCTKISEGCQNCYAEKMAWRLKCMGIPKYQDVVDRNGWTGEIGIDFSVFNKLPTRVAKSVFICSMSDLFHENIEDWQIIRVFQAIIDSPAHTFLLLTKRPERMGQWFSEYWNPNKKISTKYRGQVQQLNLRKAECSECSFWFLGCVHGRKEWTNKAVTPNYREVEGGYVCDAFRWNPCSYNHGRAVDQNDGDLSVRADDLYGPFPSPLQNLWLGVTVENRDQYVERWNILSQISAAVKFLSIEPALEWFDIDVWSHPPDWVIWGPETGPGKRPYKDEWALMTYKKCRDHGIPFFDKRKDFLAREFPK